MNVPAAVELQDRVAVAGDGGKVTLAGLMAVQVSPVGSGVSDSATVPAKPLTAVTVIVDTADEPAFTAAGEVAVMVKSRKVNVAVAAWVRELLVPVIITVKVPAAVALQDNVAVAGDGGRVTLAGLIAVQVRPAGRGVSERATVPAKPFTAVTVIVEVAEEPEGTAAGEVAAMVKSTKVNVAVAVWVSEPLVPVMVTVKVPAEVELQDNVAVAGDGGRVTLPGLIAVQVSPEGKGVSDRLTVPVNPLTAVTVIVEVADWPALTAAGEVAVTVKSAPKVNVADAV